MTDDAETRLRALERRLRREKLALERLNPLEHPDRYTAAFTRVVDLEAERRELRTAILDQEGPPGTGSEDPDTW